LNIALSPTPENELKQYVYYLATNHLPNKLNGDVVECLLCYTIVQVVKIKEEYKLEDDYGIVYSKHDFHSFYELPQYYEPVCCTGA
jgi:hypothetical protein